MNEKEAKKEWNNRNWIMACCTERGDVNRRPEIVPLSRNLKCQIKFAV